MKKLLFILANLIAFSCAMLLWQINIPPRIFVFDFLCIIFSVLFFIFFFIRKEMSLPPKELRYLIALQWLYLFVIVLSGIKIILLNGGEESYTQYLKGFISELFHVVFFTLFIVFFSACDDKKRKTILRFFIGGVICSCCYGIAQMLLLSRLGIDLDSFWNYISYNSKSSPDHVVTWEVMGITRGRGFAGINASATYIVTILPLLLFMASRSKNVLGKIGVVLALMGLLLTMSRTGILSSLTAFILFLIYQRRRLFKTILSVVLIGIPLSGLGYFFWDYIIQILPYRARADHFRLDLYQGGLYLFKQNPILGIGANNYSVARFTLPVEFYQDANLHSSWLSILSELGLVGLFAKLALFTYVIRVCVSKGTIYGRALICALVGLSVGAFFNEIFDAFYFNLFIVLLFSVAVMEDKTRSC